MKTKMVTDWDKINAALGATVTDVRKLDLADMQAKMKQRVRGQDEIVDDLCDFIYTEWRRTKRTKPIANVLFLGPTGVGKTELALALAGYLYESDSNVLEFACGEFKAPESVTRLIGTPKGYAGAESGGQLTRPMITNNKRVVVFDEIEKAFAGVNDLFLSMLDKGRVTEATGKVADFTNAIVILTSNAENQAIAKLQAEVKDPDERVQAIKDQLSEAGVFRPEIVARLDRIYVFNVLPKPVMAQIVVMKIGKLAADYGLDLQYVEPELVVDAVERSAARAKYGIRELTRIVGDMFKRPMVDAQEAGHKHIRIGVAGGKVQIEGVEPEADDDDEVDAKVDAEPEPPRPSARPGKR